MKKPKGKFKTFALTPVQRRALKRAERNFAEGKTISLEELRRELDRHFSKR